MQLPDSATWGATRSRAGLRPVPVTTVTIRCVPTPRRPGDPRPDRATTEVLRLVAAGRSNRDFAGGRAQRQP
jgi:hypothetical protein